MPLHRPRLWSGMDRTARMPMHRTRQLGGEGNADANTPHALVRRHGDSADAGAPHASSVVWGARMPMHRTRSCSDMDMSARVPMHRTLVRRHGERGCQCTARAHAPTWTGQRGCQRTARTSSGATVGFTPLSAWAGPGRRRGARCSPFSPVSSLRNPPVS